MQPGDLLGENAILAKEHLLKGVQRRLDAEPSVEPGMDILQLRPLNAVFTIKLPTERSHMNELRRKQQGNHPDDPQNRER